jgi:hypothetical protein
MEAPVEPVGGSGGRRAAARACGPSRRRLMCARVPTPPKKTTCSDGHAGEPLHQEPALLHAVRAQKPVSLVAAFSPLAAPLLPAASGAATPSARTSPTAAAVVPHNAVALPTQPAAAITCRA